jgi:hypothetical protein
MSRIGGPMGVVPRGDPKHEVLDARRDDIFESARDLLEASDLDEVRLGILSLARGVDLTVGRRYK